MASLGESDIAALNNLSFSSQSIAGIAFANHSIHPSRAHRFKPNPGNDGDSRWSGSIEINSYGLAAVETTREDTNMDDSEIIARVLAGQQEAFGALVERYQRQLYYFVVGKVAEDTEAKDIV